MKATLLCALLGFTTAHKIHQHQHFANVDDDQFYSKVIGTMQVNAGDSEELSKDASKGVFSDQIPTNLLRELTNGDVYTSASINAQKQRDAEAAAFAKQ